MQVNLTIRKCEFKHYICVITILNEKNNSKKLAADNNYDSSSGS